MAPLSEYALCMSRLSARIFGEVTRPTDSKSVKVVNLFSEQPLAKKKETYDWYPNHKTYFVLMGALRFLGLYRDEHQDFKDEQRRLKKLRGKGKLRKGEGKRAPKKRNSISSSRKKIPSSVTKKVHHFLSAYQRNMTSLSRLQSSCDWFLEDDILILQNYNDLGFII